MLREPTPEEARWIKRLHRTLRDAPSTVAVILCGDSSLTVVDRQAYLDATFSSDCYDGFTCAKSTEIACITDISETLRSGGL